MTFAARTFRGGAPTGPTNTGWLSPGSTSTSTDFDYVFANTGNIVSSDNAYATCTLPPGGTAAALLAYNFNASVPSGSIINGIEFRIEVKASTSHAGSMSPSTMALATEANFYGVGMFENSSTIDLTTTESYQSGGSTTGGVDASWGKFSNDLGETFTETLTVSILNSTSFGLIFYATNFMGAPSTISVDHIQLRVHYTAP